MLFVETRVFSDCVRDLLEDEVFRSFQNELAQNPEKGAVMPGCGGLRKVRVENPRRGKGKRGGCRVIYLYIPEVDRIDLLAVYSKERQDNLSFGQRRELREIAESIRREAFSRKGK